MRKILFILLFGLSFLTKAQSFKEQVKHEVGLSLSTGDLFINTYIEYRTSYLFKTNQSLGIKTGCYLAYIYNYYIPLDISFTQTLAKNNNVRFMIDLGMPLISYEKSKRFYEFMDGILMWQSPNKGYKGFYKRFYNVNTLFDFTAKQVPGFTCEVGLRWVFYEATDNLDKTLVVGMQPDFGFKWRIGCNKKERKAKE